VLIELLAVKRFASNGDDSAYVCRRVRDNTGKSRVYSSKKVEALKNERIIDTDFLDVAAYGRNRSKVVEVGIVRACSNC